LKKSSKRRVLFAVRIATMIGAAFAVNGITDTLGQEKEKSWSVYIATEGVEEATYTPEAGATETQPTETAKATKEPLITSMDWDEDDSYMLCKIAMAEAESEGVEGKALVMLVVLNRVWSEEFPDTIEEVIFQKNQFSPVANGRYDEVEPDKECYEALEMIQFEHWNESQDALYFESKSDSKWHSENLEFLFKYGRHYFYK
jgi:spore germination cell wall hydrolase CwlJ-like protein